jgi:3-phenylpropionate/trans-cinnamate dioxygenase ferredoxin reductase component
MSAMTRREIEADVESGLLALGRSVRYWRTPWGLIAPATEEVANKHRLVLVGWTADTEDWRGGAPEEMLARIRDRISPGAIVLIIEDWLRDFGVALRLGVRIESVERTDGGLALHLDDGDTLDTRTVLFATGVRPRIQLAAEAGLEVGHGIITDSSMRTSAWGIYAVGDIAQAYNESAGRHLSVEHWGDALEHGRIAGTVLAGGEAVWSRIPGFWSTIGDKRLKYWAWGDGWDEQVFEVEGEAFTVWYGKEGVLVGVLSHGTDEDYQRGRGLIERGESFPR